jgi:hypothetical protein
MTFWNDIYELRRQNLIPQQWRRKHIMPYLKHKYKASTIWTVPPNQSISKDRRVQGNYVQRGMQPKAYRIAPGLFELIEEPSARSLQKSLNQRQTKSRSSDRAKPSKRPGDIRLPSNIARELDLNGPLIVEKTAGGVLLRASKLSWEETAQQMAESDEDWSVFDVAVADGLNGSH